MQTDHPFRFRSRFRTVLALVAVLALLTAVPAVAAPSDATVSVLGDLWTALTAPVTALLNVVDAAPAEGGPVAGPDVERLDVPSPSDDDRGSGQDPNG